MEKMSKSLGNILTVKEILKDWHPEVLRLFFLSHHYRSPVDYAEDSFRDAQAGLDRFYSTLKAMKDEVGRGPSPSGAQGGSSILKEARQNIESFRTRFEEAMDDDFNTAQALGYFYDLQRHLNSLLDISKGHPFNEIISMLNQGLDHFSKTGWVFGLFREDPEQYLAQRRREGLRKLNLTEEEILRSIGERNLARKEKNYKKADEIRDSLLSKGIVLEDTPSGTIWKIK
jgi:cysteinyl-tRNA synthetase